MPKRVNSTGFSLPEDFREWQKYFPTQPLNTSLYTGERARYESVVYAGLVQALGLESSVEDLKLVAPEEWTIAQMGSSRLHLQFLQFLIKMIGAKRILEIGTFAGLSAIAFAQAAPTDAKIVTIEKFAKFADLARENILRNAFENTVRVIEGDALNLIERGELTGNFDFVFIDGDKGRYLDYVKFALTRLTSGGLIVVDDIFFQGDVFNEPPTTEKGQGVRACLDCVVAQKDLLVTVVPVSNGVLLVNRRTADQS